MHVLETISCCRSDSLSFINTTTQIGTVDDSDVSSCMRSGRGSRTPSRLASSEMSGNGFEKYDIPAFLRPKSDGPASIASESSPETESYAPVRPPRDDAMVPKLELRKDLGPQEFVLEMQKRISRVLRFRGLPNRVNELFAYGLPEPIAEQLRQQIGTHGSEREVVFAFLMNLLGHDELSALFVSGMSRLIQGAWARTPQNAQLLECIKTSLFGLNSSEWNWSAQADYTFANVA
jgi:hypothetical protein